MQTGTLRLLRTMGSRSWLGDVSRLTLMEELEGRRNDR